MKKILNLFLQTITILLVVLVTGMLPSLFISVLVVMFTDITISDVITFPPFWKINIIGWAIAGIYYGIVLEEI